MLPAIAAAVHAAAAALPAATPFIAATAVGFGIVGSHVPEPEVITLKGTPELAAECVKRSVASHADRLAAVVQPLYGAGTYGIVLKRGGVTGDPVMTVLLHETAGGTTADFRSLAPAGQYADVLAQMIAGCRVAAAK